MKAFGVCVRTQCRTLTYSAIGRSSIDVHMSALDLFEICAVTVIPL